MTRATARRGRGGRRRIVFSFLRVWFGRCRPAFIRQNYTNILSFPKKNHEIDMFEKQFNSFVLSAWLSSMPVCFLTTTMFVFKDNRDNRNNKKNGRNCGMSRGDIQQRQQDYCWQLSTTPYILKTTETTITTGRTGATAGCHEVTYNWDNKITSAVIGFVPLFYDNC